MVWVTKYKFKEHVRYSNKTPKSDLIKMWNDEGMFESRGSSLQKRSWVLERNSQTNNEHYKIDEEESARLMEIREGNLLSNAKKKKDETVSMSDLVNVLGGLAGNSQPKEEPKKTVKKVAKAIESPIVTDNPEIPQIPQSESNELSGSINLESMSLEELKDYCKDNGIKYHHAAKEGKLIELIKAQ